MPSPAEGVVSQILVQEGETVEVGTVLALIAPAGAPVRRRRASSGARGACTGTCRCGPEPSVPEPVAAAPEPAAAAPEPAPAAAEPVATPAPPAAATGNGRTFVSPVVARIAAEHGIDPTIVPGTGTGGRVTKKDILGYIESGAPATPAAPAATPAPPPPAPEPEPVAAVAEPPISEPVPEPAPAAAAPPLHLLRPHLLRLLLRLDRLRRPQLRPRSPRERSPPARSSSR